MEAGLRPRAAGSPAAVATIPARGRAPVARAARDVAEVLPSLETTAAALARPLPVERIAEIAGDAGTHALDAAIVVVAVHPAAGGHAGAVRVAGHSEDLRSWLSRSLTDAAAVHATVARWAPGVQALSAAIPPAEHPLGVIVAARTDGRGFSAEETAYLTVLAALCGLALERVRLIAERSRLRALLRRQHAASHLRLGDMDIDLEEHVVLVGRRRVSLTRSELRLLLFLAEQPGLPRTRQEILRHLWHTEHIGDERACDAHISNLRRKIEQHPSRPERVVTLRGVGYALRPRRGEV